MFSKALKHGGVDFKFVYNVYRRVRRRKSPSKFPVRNRKMASKDAITKLYMRDKKTFADVFNFLIYEGQKTINPDNLRELDSSVVVVPYGKDGKPFPAQKTRDLLKLATIMADDEAIYVALGIENQSQIHYAMPVRIMFYDAAYYVSQIEETATKHRADSDKPETGAEFLSGFYRTDKMTPVITVVFYFGSEPWTGPRSLYDMFPVLNKALQKFVPDYPINLIAPFELSDNEIERFHTDLKQVAQSVKYANDLNRFKEVMSGVPNGGRLSRRAADVINVVTNANLKFPENEEEVDMCLAIEEMRREEREEGREEGILEILHGLVEDGLISIEEAAKRAKVSVEEFLAAKK